MFYLYSLSLGLCTSLNPTLMEGLASCCCIRKIGHRITRRNSNIADYRLMAVGKLLLGAFLPRSGLVGVTVCNTASHEQAMEWHSHTAAQPSLQQRLIWSEWSLKVRVSLTLLVCFATCSHFSKKACLLVVISQRRMKMKHLTSLTIT